MLAFFIFLFFLLLENLFLPAITGPQAFLITPLFLLGMFIHSPKIKTTLPWIILFTLTTEWFVRAEIGSLLIPLLIVLALYSWVNRYLDLTSNFRENPGLAGIITGTLILTFFLFLYSWLSIFYNSSYDLHSAWQNWRTFLQTSYGPTLGWALAMTFLFKHILSVSNTKRII